MKNVEKLVPIAVAGLVLASAGSIDARAEEGDPSATLPDDNVAGEQKQEVTAPSTDINNLTPSDEEGGQYIVNLDTNVNTDKVGKDTDAGQGSDTADVFVDYDGILNVEAGTPETTDPVRGTDADGNPVDIQETTQNTDVTGNVTSDEVSGLPLDEDDKETVKDFEKELEDAANSASGSQNSDWTLGSVQKGAEIGGFIAVGDAESKTDEIKDDNGNVLSTTTTVTARFEKEVDTEAPAPLQKSELEQILNTTLTKNEDGTYTTADGRILTVKDESTSNTKTTYSFSLTQTTTVTNGSANVQDNEMQYEDSSNPSVEDKDKLSAKEALEKVTVDKDAERLPNGDYSGTYDGNTAVVTLNEDGTVAKVVAGDMTYEFGYTVKSTAEDVTGLTNDQIIKLLPKDQGYKLEDGKIFKTIDGVDTELNFSDVQEILTTVEVSLKTTQKNGSSTAPTYTDQDGKNLGSETEAVASIQGTDEAALNAALDKVGKAYGITYEAFERNGETGKWEASYTDPKDGKTKILSVTVDVNVDNNTTTVYHPNGVKSQETVTNTGSAYVTGGQITWSGSEQITNSVVTVNDQGEIVFNNAYFQDVTNLVVTETSENVYVVTYEKDGATYREEYTLTISDEIDPGDLPEELGKIDGSITGLKKVTWTMNGTKTTAKPDETSTDKTRNDTAVSVGEATIDNVKQTDDGYTYTETYTDAKGVERTEEVALVKRDEGKYTGTSTKTGIEYTIEETEVPLTSAEILKLLQNSTEFAVPDGFILSENDITVDSNGAGAGTATYRKTDGSTMVVSFTAPKSTSLTLTAVATETKEFADADSEDDVYQAAAEWAFAQYQSGNKDVVVEILGLNPDKITSETTLKEFIEMIQEADKAVENKIDFTAMSAKQLEDLLKELEEQSLKNSAEAGKDPYVLHEGHYDYYIFAESKGETRIVDGVKYTCVDKYMNIWKQGEATWHDDGSKWEWRNLPANAPEEVVTARKGLINGEYWEYRPTENRWCVRIERGYWTGYDTLSQEEYHADANNYIHIPIPDSYKGTGLHTELGHLDMVLGSTLSPDEDSQGEDSQGEECVLLNGFQVWLNSTAEGIVSGEGSEEAHFKPDVDWDPQDGGFWQYNRDAQNKGLNTQNYLDRTNKFYKVKGTIAYGLETYDSLQAAQKAGGLGYIRVPKVVEGEEVKDQDGKTVYVYKVYTKTAELTTYGYLGPENNACIYDYDLKLGNLKLLAGGEKATSVNKEVTTYSLSLTKRTTTTTRSQAQKSLTLGNIVTTNKVKDEVDELNDGGSAVGGNWTATKELEKSEKVTDKNGQQLDVVASATESRSYTETIGLADLVQDQRASTGTRYAGTLTYDYTTTGSFAAAAEATKTESQTRDIKAGLSTVLRTETPVQSTTPTPTPTPTPNPTVTPGGGGSDDGGDDDSDPAPVVDVEDEDVPLAETPDVEIPEEDVPLAETPDLEIPDEDVPLAAVPQTGDNLLLEALALAASGVSALWLGLNKKRNS